MEINDKVKLTSKFVEEMLNGFHFSNGSDYHHNKSALLNETFTIAKKIKIDYATVSIWSDGVAYLLKYQDGTDLHALVDGKDFKAINSNAEKSKSVENPKNILPKNTPLEKVAPKPPKPIKINSEVTIRENHLETYSDFEGLTANTVFIVTGRYTSVEENPAYDEGMEGEALFDLKYKETNKPFHCSLYEFELKAK